MSVISRVAQSPMELSAHDLVELVLEVQFDEPDRRRDRDLPVWLRDVLVMGELDTHLQMEGLLTWWDNAAADDLELACETLKRIGLGDQAALLCEVETAMPARSLLDATARDVSAVTSFAERHPQLTDTQYELVASIEPRLWYSDPEAPDVYELLVAHVAAGRQERD